MPNVKIFVDETLLPECRAALVSALPALRGLLCARLNVAVSACQFAVLSVIAMPEQPRVNVEIHLMPHADRSRESLTALAAQVQAQVGAATASPTAVRIATLNPETYVALK